MNKETISQPAQSGKSNRLLCVLVCAALIVAVLAIYGPVFRYGFVSYDDATYLSENPHVNGGLTWPNIRWAFTTREAANWVPLTWLSHQLDFQVFGDHPGEQHAVNVILHAANCVLLFLLLLRLTRKSNTRVAFWCSAVVAALFAVHPLHVESVAWISERKDVLSTFFGFLTILAYARYAEKPSVRAYLPVVLLFALSLMAKPMLVTLPALLLILDYWPLDRLRAAKANIVRILLEKAVLLAMAGAVSAAAIMADYSGGRIGATYSLSLRFGNAVVAYIRYLLLAVWPAHLSVIYPLSGAPLPPWEVMACSVALGAVSAFALVTARSRPYLLVGWFWYLAALLPVTNIVQIHHLAMADRYAYVPLIGVFLAVAWGVAAVWTKRPRAAATARFLQSRTVRVGAVVIVGAGLLALSVTARRQVYCWRDSLALFTQAIRSTSNNNVEAGLGLANALAEKGDFAQADRVYAAVVEVKDSSYRNIIAQALDNWAGMKVRQAQISTDTLDAESLLQEALQKNAAAYQLAPEDALNLFNWANLLSTIAQRRNPITARILVGQAAQKYADVCRLEPGHYKAYWNWGNMLLRHGVIETGQEADMYLKEAVEKYEAALKIKPDLYQALDECGVAELEMAKGKRIDEAGPFFQQAEAHLKEAERISPGSAAYNLGCLYVAWRNEAESRRWLEKALALGVLPSRAQLEADSDLNPVRTKEWFQALVAQAKK